MMEPQEDSLPKSTIVIAREFTSHHFRHLDTTGVYVRALPATKIVALQMFTTPSLLSQVCAVYICWFSTRISQAATCTCRKLYCSLAKMGLLSTVSPGTNIT